MNNRAHIYHMLQLETDEDYADSWCTGVLIEATRYVFQEPVATIFSAYLKFKHDNSIKPGVGCIVLQQYLRREHPEELNIIMESKIYQKLMNPSKSQTYHTTGSPFA